MSELRRTITVIAAALGGLGVVAGAFGAHALKASLAPDRLALWQTAVDYQFWHALALLGLAALAPGRADAGVAADRPLRLAGALFAAGILVFSGSLYLLALGAPRGLGLLTPIGGLALIGGWAFLLRAGLRRSPPA